MYHKEETATCIGIANKLKQYGIKTDMQSGKIIYEKRLLLDLECEQLHLLRHAETIGTSTHRFMSNNSSNSYLTECGKNMLNKVAEQVEQMDLDCILYSDIPRVKKTAEIIHSRLERYIRFIDISWMVGIDNAGWEEKTKDELKGIDAIDFYQREVEHNIFAKSSRGSSWGRVLVRCIELIEYLNKNHKGENVLLISQGSILIGIQTILQVDNEPWARYNADRFFCLNEEGKKNYGKLQEIYTKKYF